MPIIDSQVHAYERNHPERPWVGTLAGPEEVTGDQMVAAMGAVGVDGAILVSPYSLYRYDASYVLEVHARHPGRFGLVKPFDPTQADAADAVASWAATPGVVGARIMMSQQYTGGKLAPGDAGVDRIVQAAGEHGLPVNVLSWGQVSLIDDLARRHPNTQLVVDHLGLVQPFYPPAPAEPFADLPAVLALAQFDNVAIKVSGACTLSHQPYPYPDIWAPLEQVFRAFGFERCLWGTDWTRASNILTYEQGVEPFRSTGLISDSERAMLMGESTARIYKWSPGVAAS